MNLHSKLNSFILTPFHFRTVFCVFGALRVNDFIVTSQDRLSYIKQIVHFTSTSKVIEIFRSSRQNYGTRKIKVELKKQALIVSRRRIGRIMNEQGLVSSYTVAQFKPQKDKCNESAIHNELNREFDQDKERESS